VEGHRVIVAASVGVSSVTVASQEVYFCRARKFSTHRGERHILATALVVDFRGRWLVRLLVLLPWVAPISLGSIGWLWIFDSIYSVINWMARAAGVLGPNEWPIWLGQPTQARASIIVVNVWRILPLATVIVLAGLSSIPQDIHDAAEVDGAGFWRHHFQITTPLILTAVIFAFILVTQEFVYGVTFITASSNYTVSVGAPTFLVRGDVYFWGSMMAACQIASVPIAIIYNFFVARFVAGFTMGAIK
jgi:ABC-type sugar transport system permease subunit